MFILSHGSPKSLRKFQLNGKHFRIPICLRKIISPTYTRPIRTLVRVWENNLQAHWHSARGGTMSPRWQKEMQKGSRPKSQLRSHQSSRWTSQAHREPVSHIRTLLTGNGRHWQISSKPACCFLYCSSMLFAVLLSSEWTRTSSARRQCTALVHDMRTCCVCPALFSRCLHSAVILAMIDDDVQLLPLENNGRAWDRSVQSQKMRMVNGDNTSDILRRSIRGVYVITFPGTSIA